MTKKERKELEAVKAAQEKVLNILREQHGYYIWTPFAEEEGGVQEYLFRAPRHDLPDNEWLKSESPAVVHVCRPVHLIESVQKGEKERTIAHSGYVKRVTTREDDKYKTGKFCVRCDKELSDRLYKLFDGLITIYNNTTHRS